MDGCREAWGNTIGQPYAADHEENHMRLHVYVHRATRVWAIVLDLILLLMAGPTSAQPVDIPATWGGATSGPAPASLAAGGGC